MKKVILSLLATLSIMICDGQTTITAIAGTNRWDVAASWDLNRVPLDNDRVVIPVGRTIAIRNPNTVTGTIGVRINLYGTLSFPTNGADKIGLPCNSIIQIYSAGSIISTGGV